MTQRVNFASALCMAALVLTATAVTAETGSHLARLSPWRCADWPGVQRKVG
jgi:hypothetical protein